MGPRAEDFTGISYKEPSNRKEFCSVQDWLEGKRADDGAEGLWRVHDKLYDLTVWMKNHPGGKYWLEVTRGTDITEAFECNHVADTAEKILPKFYVREAKSPRSSLITFHENGFFKTLKRKVRERNLVSNQRPQLKTKLLADSLVVSVFATSLLGAISSYWWAALSGIFLNMLAVCAHNFFHMRDNWRMYYFNLSLMSLSEWRVSHVLSHHLFPNTKLDLEISMFEPVFTFLPIEDKKLRYLSWIISPFVFASVVHFQVLRRILDVVVSNKMNYRWEELVGLTLPLFIYIFSGQSLWVTFVTWNITISSGSFFFALIGLTAAHHHPDIYHDGDFLGNNKDFGILQLAAVRDRIDVDGSFILTMTMFGEHALHHIFPTVDHSRLPLLSPVLEETCKEFNINFKPLNIRNLAAGMFRQLVRNYKNTKLTILKAE